MTKMNTSKTTTNLPTKDEWIVALRSEEYKQTKGCLRKTNDKGKPSYCCMGVLLDLVPDRVWEEVPACIGASDTGDRQKCYLPNQKLSYLPSSGPLEILRNVLGLNDMDTLDNICRRLIELNDNRGCSFKVIASYLEKEEHLKPLDEPWDKE